MATTEHPLVQLARQSIEAYVVRGQVLAPPEDPCEEMRARAGVFVSLHCPEGLRGCIGTIDPVCDSVAEEIISNAISAASRDPRFSPVRQDELESLEISVDVLTAPEPVASLAELDPKDYGVIVQCGGRRGLLLPDLDGVDDAETQVAIALRKAWIRPDERYHMFRFRVLRYR